MLSLLNITKDYGENEQIVHALKGISVDFRKSEFVSILGPSGCGKTTTLNIIGGLDRYTSGDLIINNKSTKTFSDYEWDSYRNHSIGFVFQTYNLIPHQTVLGNVELALTLSGISKAERKEKAIDVLKKVGLEDKIYKRPNQLSGGQMQRVAIARALVNDPDILLADEPTGALDTETSLQVLELLKEISKTKLVIMVTHNPVLAEKYSSRIIKLEDGKIISDTNPYTNQKTQKIEPPKVKLKKTSMSFFTALSLSLKNLFTKITRTILTAFAGSIGIIGIALILSLSSGFQNYINKVQRETLSTYPVMIESVTADLATMLETLNNQGEGNKEEFPQSETVESNNIFQTLLANLAGGTHKNDLSSFKTYLDNPNTQEALKNSISAIQYSYNLNLNVYLPNYSENDVSMVHPLSMLTLPPELQMMSAMLTQLEVYSELIANEELLNSQYDIVKGKMPSNYNEVIIVVDEYNQINDYMLYGMGLKSQKEFTEMILNFIDPERYPYTPTTYTGTYDDLLNMKYKVLLPGYYYSKSSTYSQTNPKYDDRSTDKSYIAQMLDEHAIDLEVVGILRPKKEAVATAITGVVGYTEHLTKYIVNETNKIDIVKDQYNSPTIDVFTGNEFTVNTFEFNLEKLQMRTLENPSTIYIYPLSFEAKDNIISNINSYNDSRLTEGLSEIKYTDYIGLMMSSITTIINAITYVLIAFVAISLVVSSIMIGIITYISVLERTKEIGILRSIGARKKDISRVFNAETLIVGFVSGMLGIVVTMILNVPINIIIHSLADISISASLPLLGGVILVLISMLLTFIAGLIPSRLAAKKDPVIALRSGE